MLRFTISDCKNEGCIYHRINNKCAKNNEKIAKNVPRLNDIHDPEICQVRSQINKYRLDRLLEDAE